MAKKRRSQGHRRSLLDEMEHEEQSNRMYDDEDDDGGEDEDDNNFGSIFMGDDDDEDDEDEVDALLFGVEEGNPSYSTHSQHRGQIRSNAAGTGGGASSASVDHLGGSMNSRSNNSATLMLDPLYEDSDELGLVDANDMGYEDNDMGYEDPDAASSTAAGSHNDLRTSSTRRSFNSLRDSSETNDTARSAGGVFSSELSSVSGGTATGGGGGPSSNSNNDNRSNLLMTTKNNYSSRRQVITRGSRDNDVAGESSTAGGTGGGSGSISGPMGLVKTAIRMRTSFLHGVRSSTRGGSADSATTGSGNCNPNAASNITDAVSRLNIHRSSEFEHVAAAAAVVAASSQPIAKRGVQFGRGDFALVMLTLLGMADQDGEKDAYTVDPVNAHGYPQGKGKTETQKQGPFLFVLCQVTQVHFDEDERYYTVRRCDTGKEQRADQAYMEPIRDDEAIDVALRAAQRTQRDARDHLEREDKNMSLWHRFSESYSHFVEERFVPFYSRTRNSAKIVAKHMMNGDHGYAINLRFSSINFLVLCSLIFLFLDVVTISFFTAEWDQSAAIVGLVVWSILVVELLFEFLIRPSNYRELVTSDKAFAPTTARHINRYHLLCEALALILYIPDVSCAASKSCSSIGGYPPLWAITSLSFWKAAAGRFLLGLTFLRAFGLVRHWKQMWINHTFEKKDGQSSMVRRLLLVEERKNTLRRMMLRRRKKLDEDNESTNEEDEGLKLMTNEAKADTEEDIQLKRAANIGTALMLVNSHRALFLMLVIVALGPTLYSATTRNPVSYNEVHLLQANNLASNTTDTCDYLENAVLAWFRSVKLVRPSFHPGNEDSIIQWVQMLPVRCDWQNEDGVVTYCEGFPSETSSRLSCDVWESSLPSFPEDATPQYFADERGLRIQGINEIFVNETGPADFGDGNTTVYFSVRAIFNETDAIAYTYFALFLLMTGMIVLVLVGLTVMRSDAQRLVLFPLQRMLIIVVRYAENPLSTPTSKTSKSEGGRRGSKRGSGGNGGVEMEAEEQLGHYETEQLINAIAKIADLLRKCWGVAGAGIISSNLARTKDGKTVVFNPTIPGKQVYALFGFIGINDFSKQLRALEGDVMILINDVARVVHDEVYRWALGDSGQCNKNLGSAFLMVFRIGDFSEVHDRKKRATDVVFNSQMKNVKLKQRQTPTRKGRRNSSRDLGSGGTLSLASLPGIQAFADRALLGCLKSFAGLHRDQNLQNWQKDFRLGAGVGNFTINAIYGFDAGWAVEGAVGSEYKIDATYLSPHVNMASRMMSACKQYGVKVLLSQAVEELLSKPARTKLRHLDTVYVKGSAVDQRIYTYDARHDGADFFLFERSPEQADIEAESYTPSIWETDQDLKSMRQHVTDEFQEKYHEGLHEYLEGNWKDAIRLLQEADNMMFEAVVEAGYVDYMSEDLREYGRATTKTSKDELARLKNEFGDGACKCLINFMQRRDGIPPSDWHGVRHLMSK